MAIVHGIDVRPDFWREIGAEVKCGEGNWWVVFYRADRKVQWDLCAQRHRDREGVVGLRWLGYMRGVDQAAAEYWRSR